MGGTLTDRRMTELLNKPALKLVYEVMLKHPHTNLQSRFITQNVIRIVTTE